MSQLYESLHRPIWERAEAKFHELDDAYRRRKLSKEEYLKRSSQVFREQQEELSVVWEQVWLNKGKA